MSSADLYTPADAVHERELADRMATAWQCEVHRFARYSPLDAWLERRERVIALAELKTYGHASDRFDCAWLDVSKYVPLVHAAMAFGVPGLYVLAFTDRVLWADVRQLSALPPPAVVGRTDRPGVRLDQEPAIRLPIDAMGVL